MIPNCLSCKNGKQTDSAVQCDVVSMQLHKSAIVKEMDCDYYEEQETKEVEKG